MRRYGFDRSLGAVYPVEEGHGSGDPVEGANDARDQGPMGAEDQNFVAGRQDGSSGSAKCTGSSGGYQDTRALGLETGPFSIDLDEGVEKIG